MVYVHVPFCKSFCIYCGFYSESLSRCGGVKAVEQWAEAVCAEALSRKDEILSSIGTDTLYIGGGTPSVLPLSVLGQVVNRIREICGKKGEETFEEFTVEVNPDDIVKGGLPYLEGLRKLGINRISMGVQSFDDGILRWMGRRHSSSDAEKAVELIREAGFTNLSLDLISGIRGLSDEMWEDTLEKTLSLSPEHISAYQLSVEEGSVLDEMVSTGKYSEADDAQCERQYRILCRKLSDAGYVHYEVSNFSKPGKEAIHNSAYWRRAPYVGLGPGAHSLVGERERRWNSETVPSYSSSNEILSDEDLRVERVMLSLRTAKGISEEELVRLCGQDKVRRMLNEGSIISSGSVIRIPEDHFFTSDSIIRELL